MARGATPEQLLAEMSRRDDARPVGIPKRYTEFVTWLGVSPTLGQRVVMLVTEDEVDPCDLDGAEREMAKRIFGDVERVPDIAREVIVDVCGRRGGKSYLFEALPLVHAMYTVPLFMVAPGQIPIALVISPNDVLRQEVTNYAFGAIRSHPVLRRTLVLAKGQEDAPIVSQFMIRRPGTGELVGFTGGVATKGGYGGRGKSMVGACLDEAAFFRGETNVVSDKEIFNACIPGLLPSAKMRIGTTPWAQAGLVWELFSENHGHPVSAVVAHAPTQLLRPELAGEVEQERTKDPDLCERERDAKFMGMGTVRFFTDDLIDRFFDKQASYPIPPMPGHERRAAADLGFRSDSSAMAMSDTPPGSTVSYLALLLERRPEPGKPLIPSETCNLFAATAVAEGASYVMADGHYLESLRENGVTLAVHPAPATPNEAFIAFRTLVRDNRLKMAHPDTLVGEARTMALRLKAQMREVEATPIPGGGISIRLPRWRTGGHCDILSAAVLVGYQLGGETVPAPTKKPGDEGWEDEQRAKRRAALKNRPGKRN